MELVVDVTRDADRADALQVAWTGTERHAVEDVDDRLVVTAGIGRGQGGKAQREAAQNGSERRCPHAGLDPRGAST